MLLYIFYSYDLCQIFFIVTFEMTYIYFKFLLVVNMDLYNTYYFMNKTLLIMQLKNCIICFY